MSIPETIGFDKDGEANPRGRKWVQKFFLTALILLTAALSFGLGRLTSSAGRGGEPVRIELGTSANPQPTSTQAAAASQALPAALQGGEVVGSKNGSKYHYLSCPGAKQISEGNKITFPSPQAAEAAGYTLAANCKAP